MIATLQFSDRGGMPDPDTAEVMEWWERVLTLLQTDRNAAAPYVDWVGKLAVLERYRERDHLTWESAQLRADTATSALWCPR